MNHAEEIEHLKKLGARIKTLRLAKGFTQSECGVDDRTLRRIESQTEVFNPSYLTLIEICTALDISPSELFED